VILEVFVIIQEMDLLGAIFKIIQTAALPKTEKTATILL